MKAMRVRVVGQMATLTATLAYLDANLGGGWVSPAIAPEAPVKAKETPPPVKRKRRYKIRHYRNRASDGELGRQIAKIVIEQGGVDGMSPIEIVKTLKAAGYPYSLHEKVVQKSMYPLIEGPNPQLVRIGEGRSCRYLAKK